MDPKLLWQTTELAVRYLEGVGDRPVAVPVDAAALRTGLDVPLGADGVDASTVIAELAAAAEPGLVATQGPRYFGFVTGATMANLTCLAAARHTQLWRAGWDVEQDGLPGRPVVVAPCWIGSGACLMGTPGDWAVTGRLHDRARAEDHRVVGRCRPAVVGSGLYRLPGAATVPGAAIGRAIG